MATSASAGATGATGRTHTAAGVRVGHAVGVGAVAGIIAAVVMAGYAMIASVTYQHHGFFTPLYHIASTFIAPKTLMISMQHAMTGSSYYFSFGPAVLGAVIHMMVGAMYGAVFAVAVSMMRLRVAALVAAGAVWGAIAFTLSTWIGLPVAAKIFSSGDQITHMAKMVGYPTFLLEHVLYGLALGLLLATRRPSVRG
jgi:hypothetical protein